MLGWMTNTCQHTPRHTNLRLVSPDVGGQLLLGGVSRYLLNTWIPHLVPWVRSHHRDPGVALPKQKAQRVQLTLARKQNQTQMIIRFQKPFHFMYGLETKLAIQHMGYMSLTSLQLVVLLHWTVYSLVVLHNAMGLYLVGTAHRETCPIETDYIREKHEFREENIWL